MSNDKVKKIRVPKELLEASWGDFFQDQSIEVVDREIVEANQDGAYQITDVALPENLLLDNKDIHSLLKAYFEAGKNFDLIEKFNSKDKALFSIKIHDYLNLGHFVDTIIVEAYKNEFSPNQIRAFLNAFLTYSFQVLHGEQDYGPIEIAYGHTSAGFMVQASVTAKKFQFDKNFRRVTNFLDVTEYKKKSQFVVSALWFKAAELSDLHYYFYKEQNEHKNVNLNDANIMPAFDTENITYNPNFSQDNSSVRVSGTSGKDDGVIHIKGQKAEDNGIIRIKGSGPDAPQGNMKVSSKPQTPMEQQLLRMKDLLYKMKEQLHAQKVHYEAILDEAALATGSSDPGLENRIVELEAEKNKLQDEKKSINARLQLANRKLQIMDSNLDRSQEVVVRPNLEQEKELEMLRQQNALLETKIANQEKKFNALAAAPAPVPVVDTTAKDLEIIKLNEIKVLYENKMKEQVAEIKKHDARVKVLATQLDGALKKLTAGPAVGMKTNDNHAKQLEHASNRVAEVTKDFNDKKKEVIQVKQENEKLAGKIRELEKKLAYFEKKAA